METLLIVSEAESGRLEIWDLPDKLVYEIGEELDLTGGVCYVRDGVLGGVQYPSFLGVPMDNELFLVDDTDFDNQTPGTYTIYILDAKMLERVSFEVTVLKPGETQATTTASEVITTTTTTGANIIVTSTSDVTTTEKELPDYKLAIQACPNKQVYQVGEELDLSGSMFSYSGYNAEGEYVVQGYLTPDAELILVDTSAFNSDEPGTYPIYAYLLETMDSVKFYVAVEGNGAVFTTTTTQAGRSCDTCGTFIPEGEGYSTAIAYICKECKEAGKGGGTTAPYFTDVTTMTTTAPVCTSMPSVGTTAPADSQTELTTADTNNCVIRMCESCGMDIPESEGVYTPLGLFICAECEKAGAGGTTAPIIPDFTDTTVTETNFSQYCDVILHKPPEKKVYVVGEELDLTGATASASGMLEDGAYWDTFEQALDWFEVDISEFDSQTPGEYTIYVRTSGYEEYASFTVTVKDPEVIPKGDVDWDEVVDISDATSVLTTYAMIGASLDVSYLSDAYIQAADVNGDGVVDISDATAILTNYARIGASLEPEWE